MKKYYLMLFACLTLFTNCDYSYMDASAYKIGDIGPSGVGIVFYVTDDKQHGLEVAPADQSSSYIWSNINNVEIGSSARGTSIGSGSANTTGIISQAGHTNSAAKLCRDYRGGGKNDWFLPSKAELLLIYMNLQLRGLISFDITACYWSSSEFEFEFAAEMAWCIDLSKGILDYRAKSNTLHVRAIRAF